MRTPEMVSVIVPANNCAATLRETIDGLAAQSYGGAWETIVVDDDSSDDTVAVARREIERLAEGRVVALEGRIGVGPARTAGTAVARGDLLVFCDADDVPEPDWLAGLVRAAAEADLVSGVLRTDALNDAVTRASVPPYPRDRPLVAHEFLPFAYGGNCGMWADVFDDLGGYDDRPDHAEDVDLCWRAQLAGYHLGLATDAVLQRRLRAGTRAIVRQSVRNGLATAELYSRYRVAGMPRSRLDRALLSWAALIAAAPVAALAARFRGDWARRLGLRIGRLIGSVRHRVFYP